MKTKKQFVVGDCLYTVDGAYRVGIADYRAGLSYHCNPYRFGSTCYFQWNYGHEHASEGELPDGL